MNADVWGDRGITRGATPAPLVLGIDLGTTTSCVAVVQAGEAIVIPNADGGRTLPSVVALTADGQHLVGPAARRQAVTNAAHTVFSAKRLIGRSVDDPAVQQLQAQVPYAVVPGPGRLAAVQLQGQTYVPAQVAALLLAALKAQAEAWLGQPVTQAVITVPAYFDDAQRQATRDAGRIAGLEVLRLVNEPTAAALAYGVSQGRDATIAVYDLGGGTFDISILQVGDGLFEVKSTAGDTHLGGDDIDAALLSWLAEQCVATHGIDPRTDPVARQRLRDAAADAKVALSTLQQTEVALPFLGQGRQGPMHLHTVVTRAVLERLAAPLLAATAAPCRRALADAGLTPADLDAVLLVGGQTRMPAVRALVTAIFGRAPSHAVNPDEAVAVGAARQGAALASGGGDLLLLDVTPLTLGIATQEGQVVPLIPRNTPIPVQRTEVCTTAAADQTSVEIHVVQGERPLARDNTSLARIRLEDITPGPRGVAQIAVTFTLDADGILTVSACDGATGRTQRLTVAPTSGLSARAVERLIAEAARQRERDAQQVALIALRTEVEAGIGHAVQALQVQDERASAAVREELEWAVTALEQALPTADMAQIRSRLDVVVAGTHALQTSRERSDAA